MARSAMSRSPDRRLGRGMRDCAYADCSAPDSRENFPEFISKIGDCLKEIAETEYWLELLVETELLPQEQIETIYKETDEILAMTVASLKTLRDIR